MYVHPVILPSNASCDAHLSRCACTAMVQEQAAYDKKGFLAYIKGYIQKLTPLLPAARQAQFKTDVQAAVKHLLGKLSDLQL